VNLAEGVPKIPETLNYVQKILVRPAGSVVAGRLPDPIHPSGVRAAVRRRMVENHNKSTSTMEIQSVVMYCAGALILVRKCDSFVTISVTRGSLKQEVLK